MIALLIALQFLTRLPVSLPGMPPPEQVGRSLLWYPLVGLLLGLLLWGAHLLLGQTPALLQAAIILALWVGLSGGLHLDGLADTADAWVGGFGDRERTLTIMKDPRSGPIAVVVLVLLLLLKFAGLFTLLQAGQGIYLLLLPWLGRSLLPLLLEPRPTCGPVGWVRPWSIICRVGNCIGCLACIYWACCCSAGRGCWRWPRHCCCSSGCVARCCYAWAAPPEIPPVPWSSWPSAPCS